uniref:Uncharacterized protein n=1 Tax=Arundo donax TaxID=35708 RepID=A0A0A8YLF6_ARUDO
MQRNKIQSITMQRNKIHPWRRHRL